MKTESMLFRYKQNPPWQGELRNYLWDRYSDFWRPWVWYKKYRLHGQYNGRKPKWRKLRKQERKLKESQKNGVLSDDVEERRF